MMGGVRLIYQAAGERTEKKFRSVAAARRWVLARLGPAPKRCDPLGFAFVEDEIVVVPVTCTLDELFGVRHAKKT